MKRFILRIVLVGVFLLSAGSVVFADGEISLRLNGELIQTDVAPIIEDSRTLVPYRALLEAMGGEVLWNQEAQMATAILGNRTVQVTIDNTTGFVNGVTKTMDVPPRIVNNRTLIPLRFVLENLNCTVLWDNDTRTVVVSSPKNEQKTEIQRIYLEEEEGTYRIVAEGSDVLTDIRTFAYQEPERFGIDINYASFPDGVGSIVAENDLFYKVRFSQLDEDTVRIVIDLKEKVAGKVSLSEKRDTVSIAFDIPGGEQTETVDEEQVTQTPVTVLPTLDWRAGGKLVAIDVGHGGKDPGAEGVIDGAHVIWEKELNLPIALRLYDLLLSAGVNVQLLRDQDIYMGLYERPEAANILNADLLVSIHNNSGEFMSSRGTEVLYYQKVGEESYGLFSKEVASLVQQELMVEIGLPDHGTHNRPQLAILNKSQMPAIIIEGGFLSNPDDLAVMLTDEFIEGYAVGAAKGIIKALNASVLED